MACAALSTTCPVDGARAQAPSAEAPALSAFLGTYQNQARDGGARAIEAGVDGGIASMGPMVRAIARRRIMASNPAFRTLRIDSPSAGVVRVEFVSVRRYEAPLDGPARAAQAPDGSQVQVSFALRGGRLREAIVAPEGSSANVYRLSADGRVLTLQSTMQSPRLPNDIRYTLRFRRP